MLYCIYTVYVTNKIRVFQSFQIILLNNLAKYIGSVGLYLLSIWIPRSSKKKLKPIPTRRLKNETSTVSPEW